MMNRTTIIILLASLSLTAVQAQQKSTDNTFAGKASSIWKKTKKTTKKVTKSIKREFGIDDSKDAQLRAQYMPIYTEDRYHGDDAIALKEACLQKFRKVYPNAVVKSLVLPMKTWGSISLTEGDKVVGYQQYLTCYILAQDGTDGYINAEYRFDRQRLVGEAFEKMNGRYPKQTRIDVLPEDVYDKIKH
jgi:hypothetical protein